MIIEKIYLLSTNSFSKCVEEWAANASVQSQRLSIKKQNIEDLIDGVVVFHENFNKHKNIEELVENLVQLNRPSHRVDINGTMVATKSNFEMWMERNQIRNLLILGDDQLPKNTKFKSFLLNLN